LNVQMALLRSCAAMTTDALALAAQQQPQGTLAASVLSAAAGRAFLRVRRESPRVTRQAPSLARSDLVNALAVAAQQQPHGTPAASALAAAAGRAFLRISRRSSRQHQARSPSEHTLVNALAVAAQQQPRGTLAATVLAAAAGRAFLRTSVECSRPRAKSPCSEMDEHSVVSANEGFAGQRPSSRSSLPRLCDDTSGYIFGQLWPVQQIADRVQQASSSGLPIDTIISPQALESRLRLSKPIFGDLSRVSAVSPSWCQRVERDGWSSTHAYLFQEPGTKGQLQARYSHSMRRLMVKDWLQLCGAAAVTSVDLRSDDNIVSRIDAFLA